MSYVNYLGEEIGLVVHGKATKPKREQPSSYHNGWRVQGIPPGALEEARKTHEAEAEFHRSQGREPKLWDEANWLMNTKRKPVRGKPYEVPQAAQDCKALAEKAGWLRVEIVEMKKEAQ